MENDVRDKISGSANLEERKKERQKERKKERKRKEREPATSTRGQSGEGRKKNESETRQPIRIFPHDPIPWKRKEKKEKKKAIWVEWSPLFYSVYWIGSPIFWKDRGSNTEKRSRKKRERNWICGVVENQFLTTPISAAPPRPPSFRPG